MIAWAERAEFCANRGEDSSEEAQLAQMWAAVARALA
jgi:hypothetical protein